MLKLYDTEAFSGRITLIYRGYDLELTRATAGWWVRGFPRSADLPSCGETIFSPATKTTRSSKPKTE